MAKTFFQLLFRLLTVTLILLVSVEAFAQQSFTVKLKLSDETTSEPVGYATVSLSIEGQTTPLKYVLSAADGQAQLTKVPKGKYILKAELMGYKLYEKKVEISANTDLGEVKMKQDNKVLDAASISAVGNPIVVKKDTIEYTASSFKTSDNDMLEELLKKLPGVEVGSDGSITANGETVTKVMIDGKEFFLDDPQLASKNIPAKMVEKVRVVEKKSEQAEFTGIDDGQEETVIDLTVHKGMMNGTFGNAMLGGGHDVPQKNTYSSENPWYKEGWRYQGAAMGGRFTDKSQISIILNGNNTNNRGFNDLAGNMMQTMRGSRGMGRGTGGWGGGNGITTSWMAGANGAFDLLDGDMQLSGNYLYNGSDKNVEEQSSKVTYMDDGSSLLFDKLGYNTTFSQGHRFGVRLEHKFSENTSLIFEPQVNFGNGRFHEYTMFETYNDLGDGSDPTKTNEGFSENLGWNRNWNTSGFLLFRQRLGKPGRTLSLSVNYNFSGNDLNGFNQSFTDNDATTAGDEDMVNQRYDQTSNSSSLSGRLVYTEPLGHDFYLEANYMYSWNRSTSYKNTFDSPTNDLYTKYDGAIDGDATHLIYAYENEAPNYDYSNSIENNYQNHQAGANFMYQKDKIRAQLGASVNPTITHNVTNGENYDSKVLNWSPQMMFSYDFNDNSNIRMFYFGRSAQPSTSQLMPVADNSDPLNVSFGNPYLEPYFNHNVRAMFRYTNKETFTSVNARMGGSVVQDGITNAIWYDTNGAQYSLPLNGPLSGNVDMRVHVNSPIAKSNFSIFSMTYFRYSKSMSYLGRSGMGDSFNTDYYDSDSGVMDYELFHRDFYDYSQAGSRQRNLLDYFTESKINSLSFTQRLRFTYRNNFVEVNLGGRTRMSKSWYSVTQYNQSATWNNQVDASMNWTIPGGINLIAQANYNWYRGYTSPQEDEIIMNAELTKLLFKDKVTLAVKAYDIFNQSKNLSVTDASNYHEEVRNNTLGRYIIVSLTWRFGNFGAAQGRNPHGPGRGPMGPPPRG